MKTLKESLIYEANWKTKLKQRLDLFEMWCEDKSAVSEFLKEHSNGISAFNSRTIKQAMNIFGLACEYLQWDIPNHIPDNEEIFWDSYVSDLAWRLINESQVGPQDLCIDLMKLLKDIFDNEF